MLERLHEADAVGVEINVQNSRLRRLVISFPEAKRRL